MEATKVLNGPVLIWPKTYTDIRGCFREIYNPNYTEYAPEKWVQINHSCSRTGALRGLHYREGEAKLISVICGAIYDVVVDIRQGSETFGQWLGFNMTTGSQIYIPAGFAHGFVVVSSTAEMVYCTNKTYDPKESKGIAWDDPDLKISWGTKSPIVSEQDKCNPSWKEYLQNVK